jgi:hypothetical protein
MATGGLRSRSVSIPTARTTRTFPSITVLPECFGRLVNGRMLHRMIKPLPRRQGPGERREGGACEERGPFEAAGPVRSNWPPQPARRRSWQTRMGAVEAATIACSAANQTKSLRLEAIALARTRKSFKSNSNVRHIMK